MHITITRSTPSRQCQNKKKLWGLLLLFVRYQYSDCGFVFVFGPCCLLRFVVVVLPLGLLVRLPVQLSELNVSLVQARGVGDGVGVDAVELPELVHNLLHERLLLPPLRLLRPRRHLLLPEHHVELAVLSVIAHCTLHIAHCTRAH